MIVGVISAVISAFFMGMFMLKTLQQGKILKSANKVAKEYEKIDGKKDSRSDIDVLKKL